MLVCSIQVCVNTVPSKKDISNHLKEASLAPHQTSETAKSSRATYQALQPSMSMLNVKSHDSTIRKLKTCALFGKAAMGKPMDDDEMRK